MLAFSGGPDSVCLAALLADARLARPLLAVHVDHGLDTQSAARAEQAELLAARLGLPIEQLRVDPDPNDGGPEASARKARYRALSELMRPEETLLTAHHSNDQVETILMRLLRGAGPEGLSGIPQQRRFGPGWLVRPLLNWGREQITDWLKARDLEWTEDPSNRDLSLDRNFLRHRALPLLRERWPGLDASVLRSGRINEGAAAALADVSSDDLKQCRVDNQRLRVAGLAGLSSFRQGEVLRLWCHQAGLTAPPGRQLEEFLDQIGNGAVDRQPELRWQSHLITRNGPLLWLQIQRIETPVEWITWDGSGPLNLPNRLGQLELKSTRPLSGPLEVRFGSQSPERIRLPGRDHHHAVKQLMSEAGVPSWQRPLWPRLWQGDQLLAVGQRWVAADFLAWLTAHNGHLAWHSPFPTDIPEQVE